MATSSGLARDDVTEGSRVTVAASATHLWFAAPEPGDANSIRLYCAEQGGPHFRSPVPLRSMPTAMAAAGARAWLMFDGSMMREVYSIEVRRNPATEIDYFLPPGSLAMHQPLPRDGELRSFVGAADGPIAFRVFAESKDELVGTARLSRLTSSGWNDIALPAIAKEESWLTAGVEGDSKRAFVLAASEHSMRKFTQGDGEGWIASTVRTPVRRGLRVVGLLDGSSVFAMAADPPSPTGLFVLRATELLSIGAVEAGIGANQVAAMPGGVRVVRRANDEGFMLSTVDPRTGRESQGQRMTGQSLGSPTRLYLPVAITMLMAVAVAIVLIRPGPRADEIVLPKSARVARWPHRLGALGIDAGPCALIAVVALGGEARDLLAVPLWAPGDPGGVVIALAAALTACHAAIGECVAARSIGKAMLGIRVVRYDGGRPRIWQIVVRNGVKCITLIVPPLALFAILNPHRQTIGDIAAGTIVVEVRDED